MAAPLLAFQSDLEARPLAFGDRSTQRLDQCLNLCKRDRRKRWAHEDSGKGFAVLRIHEGTLSLRDSKYDGMDRFT